MLYSALDNVTATLNKLFGHLYIYSYLRIIVRTSSRPSADAIHSKSSLNEAHVPNVVSNIVALFLVDFTSSARAE